MKTFFTFMLCSVASFSFAAVDAPPKLTSNDSDRPTWNDVKTFGEVPTSLKEVGVATCQKYGFDSVKGYTKIAQSNDGSPFRNGAFLCDGRVQR